MIATAEELWGTETMAEINAPSRAGDERFLRWSARLERAIASKRVVGAYLRALLEVDVRSVLPLIQAPTLVVAHHEFPQLPVAHGRYLAEHIPRARLVELPGDLPIVWASRSWSWRWSRNSWSGPTLVPSSPGCWPRCCSPISWTRPGRPSG
jgi:pimeloyl-ACP methyl ester carboxylesterase